MIIILFIMLIIICLFFILINKINTNKYLRIKEGFKVIYQKEIPDITRFLNLKDEYNKLLIERDLKLKEKKVIEENLAYLKGSYNTELNKYLELSNLLDYLNKSIDNIRNKEIIKYNFEESIDLIYIGSLFNKIIHDFENNVIMNIMYMCLLNDFENI